jgi:hypothetical protein
MLALGVCVVLRRIVIEKFEIGDQRSAREERLEEIVA